MATHTVASMTRRIKVLSEGKKKKKQPGRNEIVIYDTHIAPVNFLKYTVF